MKELIRKILNEETKPGKYISVLEDLTGYFKNEDCVCDIKISYKPEEFRDLYLINVVLGVNEINSKFNGINYQIRDYLQKLRRKITDGVLDFLPVPFLVNFSETPKCKDYKNLQESEDKKKPLINKIEEIGLYEFIDMTGISLEDIQSQFGQIPREMLEQFIEDYVSENGNSFTSTNLNRKIVGVDLLIAGKAIIDFVISDGKFISFEVEEFENGFSEEPTDRYIESSKKYDYDTIFRVVKKIIKNRR